MGNKHVNGIRKSHSRLICFKSSVLHRLYETPFFKSFDHSYPLIMFIFSRYISLSIYKFNGSN